MMNWIRRWLDRRSMRFWKILPWAYCVAYIVCMTILMVVK